MVLLTVAACGGGPSSSAAWDGPGDPAAGKRVISRIACGICHVIPGVAGARGTVGPSLEGFAERNLIAGRLPNEFELLTRWVRDAPSFDPATGMPELPISEDEARDVAAYLHSLR